MTNFYDGYKTNMKPSSGPQPIQYMYLKSFSHYFLFYWHLFFGIRHFYVCWPFFRPLCRIHIFFVAYFNKEIICYFMRHQQKINKSHNDCRTGDGEARSDMLFFLIWNIWWATTMRALFCFHIEVIFLLLSETDNVLHPRWSIFINSKHMARLKKSQNHLNLLRCFDVFGVYCLLWSDTQNWHFSLHFRHLFIEVWKNFFLIFSRRSPTDPLISNN